MPPLETTRPSSAQRQALRRTATTFLLQFPPAARPAHIPPSTDEHRLAISEIAAWTLAPLVEDWPQPHTPQEARRRLTNWTFELAVAVDDSSRREVLIPAVVEAWPMTIMEINVWASGRWSTRTSLAEWLWRLEISPHAISAADWLWTIGAQESN
jgi:hypothetical protein